MNYQSLSAWIFAFLILIVLFMALFPTGAVIGAGLILTPILILIQTYVILRSKEPTNLPSPEDQWYER